MNSLNHTAFAAITAALMATPALAGAAPHRMPADYGRPQPVYELKISQAPVAGRAIVIALVDHSTGQAVIGGEVVAMRPVNHGPKASPMIQRVPEALSRNADGNFVCAGDHHVPGERLTLRGEGPGATSPAWLTLTVKG